MIRKTDFEPHFDNGLARSAEQRHRLFDPPPQHVRVGRFAHRLFEQACEMERAQLGFGGQCIQTEAIDRGAQMCGDEVFDAANARGR